MGLQIEDLEEALARGRTQAKPWERHPLSRASDEVVGGGEMDMAASHTERRLNLHSRFVFIIYHTEWYIICRVQKLVKSPIEL